MELSPSQVKNLMRRGLRWLVDPEPDAKAKRAIREYFGHQCAYCGAPLDARGGDIDHLVSAALGGANALANRVLACKPCNAQEKRDRDWESFLPTKCATEQVLAERTERIRSWVAFNGGHPVLSPEVLAALAAEGKRVTAEYEAACQRIRGLPTS